MIALPLYLGFMAATVALMLIPGPNVSLIVAQVLSRGRRAALMTVCGTSAAMVVQLTLVALGLSAVLTALAPWVNLLRWIGVAYLVVIAIRTWRAQPSLDLSPSTAEADFGRGLLVSMFNPKTLFFYGAFFPQFVDPARALTPQFLTLSVSFVAVAVTIDSGWALMATRLRPWLLSRGRLQQRASATLLAGAAVGLALSRLDAE